MKKYLIKERNLMNKKYFNDTNVWDNVWLKQNFQIDELQWNMERDLSIIRYGEFYSVIKEKFQNFSNLRSIELGSGRGTVSLQLAKLGIQVTLVDWSDLALDLAKELYSYFNLEPILVKANILDLPVSEYGKYDISLSVGVAEHFEGVNRESIINSHSITLRPGGISLISVPNINCPPYRINKLISEKRKKWKFGMEIPFSRPEMIKYAERSNLGIIKFTNSSLIEASNHFIIKPYLLGIIRKIFRIKFWKNGPISEFGEIPHHLMKERENLLDKKWGYLINMIAVKKENEKNS